MKNYETEQKKIIMELLRSRSDRLFSVEELAAACGEQCSRSTVYRLVRRLAEEGELRRTPAEGGRGFLYQYMEGEGCHDHLHLKCSLCGQITHLDHRLSAPLLDTIETLIGFSVDTTQTVLHGLCSRCRLRGKK